MLKKSKNNFTNANANQNQRQKVFDTRKRETHKPVIRRLQKLGIKERRYYL
jgi:hypothetical protein